MRLEAVENDHHRCHHDPEAELFDRVLVGVDGREGGRDAIALARKVAAPNAEIPLAHVYGGRTMGGSSPPAPG